MTAHFGSQAEKDGQLFDFDDKKTEYKGYQMWNPDFKNYEATLLGYDSEKFNEMKSKLVKKSQDRRYSKFDYN
jgi:hypothetical protein